MHVGVNYEEDIHAEALTCSGQTFGELLEHARVTDDNIIPERTRDQNPEGGIVALFGDLAPEGCVIKQSAVASEMRAFTWPARVFESESEALVALRERGVIEGEVLVIRNEGPKGGPGMPGPPLR